MNLINSSSKWNARVRRHRRCGATLVLIVVLMVVILASAAFAVDFGRMLLVRSQLQTAVDAGALAGSLQLKQDPTDIAAAQAAARDFVARNRVGFMVTVPENAIQVTVGGWDATTRDFDSQAAITDAISVSATQSNEPFFFAQIFGNSSFSIPRQSVAVAGAERMEIMMVLDLSGSMDDEGRIEALQDAAPVFVNVIEPVANDDRIGVMGYGVQKGTYNPASQGHSGVVYTATPASYFPSGSNYASEWVGVLEGPLTTDFDFLRGSVLTPTQLLAGKYGGGTPTGAAIRDGVHYLNANARAGTNKLIVLMSDGYANKPSSNGSGYALQMADYAKNTNVRIYTISLGNSADTDLMSAIAAATGGKHYDATGNSYNDDDDDNYGSSDLATLLADAFRNVASEISRTTMVQ